MGYINLMRLIFCTRRPRWGLSISNLNQDCHWPTPKTSNIRKESNHILTCDEFDCTIKLWLHVWPAITFLLLVCFTSHNLLVHTSIFRYIFLIIKVSWKVSLSRLDFNDRSHKYICNIRGRGVVKQHPHLTWNGLIYLCIWEVGIQTWIVFLTTKDFIIANQLRTSDIGVGPILKQSSFTFREDALWVWPAVG